MSVASYSLANMGYDEVHCAFSSFFLKKLDVTCPYGKITNLVKGGVGINPYTDRHR